MSSYTSEDEAIIEFKLEYMGPAAHTPAASTVGEAADETGDDAPALNEQSSLGRCVSVPVQLQYRPSLQVCTAAQAVLPMQQHSAPCACDDHAVLTVLTVKARPCYICQKKMCFTLQV